MFNQTTPFPRPQNQRPPTTRRAGLALIQVGLSASLCLWPCPTLAQASPSERSGAQTPQESISLELGKPIERELSGGLSHSYKITMTSGQFLRIVIEQRGVDVAVALSTPDGKKIAEADSERMSEGSETVSAISESAGAYLIEVLSPKKTAKPGRYEIKVEELRIATDEDRYRVAGEDLFREAKELQNGTLEAKRKSIEKYQEALNMYRRAGDRGSEAGALNNIGEVYTFLGERQKALEKFNEALPIFRAAGNRSGEAIALTSIGQIHQQLGNMQKALETYNEALAILRAVGNRSSEAIALGSIGQVYRQLGNLQKALETYNEALPIFRAVGNRSGEAGTVSGIGSIYRLEGDLQKALEKYNEALPIFRAVGDRMWEAATVSDIGSIYRMLGEMQKALEKFNEALTINRAIGGRTGVANALGEIGLVYYLLGDMQKALEPHWCGQRTRRDRPGLLFTRRYAESRRFD